MTRAQEREASRVFGRHVSGPKALCVLLASLLVCLLPMLLGLRLWDRLPPVIRSGLIGPDGADDSMPRSVLVFGVPGLFAVLDLICHGQLWLHQKAERIPPLSVRLFGRWGMPVLATALCPFWLLGAASEERTVLFYIPCALAITLLLLGSHFFDCPRGARFSFRLPRILYDDQAWRITHRTAGVSWMLAGLLLLALQYAMSRIPPFSALPLLLLLLVPLLVPVFIRR